MLPRQWAQTAVTQPHQSLTRLAPPNSMRPMGEFRPPRAAWKPPDSEEKTQSMAVPEEQIYFDALRTLEPLSALTPDQIRDLAGQSRRERLEAGVYLFREGERDRETIYLLQGSLELSQADSSVRHLLQGGSEEARHPVADDQPRRYTALTATPVEIVRINKELLDTMLTWGQISAPEEEVVMCEDGIITINKGDWLKTMIKSPTFRNLPPANIETLLTRMEPVVVRAGDVIIRQGDVGDYFYMIDKGVAMVTRHPDDDEDSIEMAELGEGATFGEAALISDNPRNATVSMLEDGILLRLAKDDFIALLKQPTLQWHTFAEAEAEVARGARWIDVRLPAEYQRGHLPDAINIPMRNLHREAHALARNVRYICYCQTGRRSSAAAFVLSQYGLEAAVLQGGLDQVDAGRLTT